MIYTQMEFEGMGLSNEQIAKRIERIVPVFRARKQKLGIRGANANRVGAIREVSRTDGRVFRKVVE